MLFIPSVTVYRSAAFNILSFYSILWYTLKVGFLNVFRSFFYLFAERNQNKMLGPYFEMNAWVFSYRINLLSFSLPRSISNCLVFLKRLKWKIQDQKMTKLTKLYTNIYSWQWWEMVCIPLRGNSVLHITYCSYLQNGCELFN